MMGTLVYLGPEVLMRRVPSFAADMYSFGITLCELATCTPPYADRARNVALAHTVLDMSYNEHDLAIAIASEQLRPALPAGTSGCPSALCDIIASCWTASPDARPSAATVRADLQKLCESHAAMLSEDTKQASPAQLRPVWHPPPPPTAAAAARRNRCHSLWRWKSRRSASVARAATR